MASKRLLNLIISGTIGSAGGIALYKYVKKDSSENSSFLPIVQSSWTTNFKPSCEWNYNWDCREPSCLVEPLPQDPTPEQQNSFNEKISKHKPKATRHLILIRHGQYILDGLTDPDRKLTPLGREQAKLTGDRLVELKFPIDDVVISTMTRAQETGKIILNQLPQRDVIEVKNDQLIEEGAPIAPVPEHSSWMPEPSEFFQEGARIEAAFRAHFYRAKPSQTADSYTVLVCHGNVIRYFFCRALQLPPEAWLRISLHHASLTWLAVYPSGRVSVRLLGDCGHMPLSHVTLS